MLAGKTDPPQKSAEGPTGETRDTLAKLAGVSHDTLSKVETLERDADDVMKAKLRSGELSINKAWTQLKKRQKKVDALRFFFDVAKFSFTYENHGTLNQVLVFKGEDIE